jgi:hypothetical protein
VVAGAQEICMSLVVVGGQARKVGKTSVVAGLISATGERRWTALKTSGHIHRPHIDATSTLIAAGRGFVLTEEFDPSGDRGFRQVPRLLGQSDTARFMAAGAEHVYWLQTEAGGLEEAIPHLRGLISPARDVIVESNSIVRWLAFDLYLLVLDFGVEEFKASALQTLDRASAFLVRRDREEPLWQGVRLPSRPMLFMDPPQYVTPEIVGFVRRGLAVEPRARHGIERTT